MEDQDSDMSDHPEATSDKTAGQTARAGAQAKGGIAARPGDPTSPKQAAARSAALDSKMTDDGFRDHKGEHSGSDGGQTS
jgi:hypothetical protein